jgi:hypothetical protein
MIDMTTGQQHYDANDMHGIAQETHHESHDYAFKQENIVVGAEDSVHSDTNGSCITQGSFHCIIHVHSRLDMLYYIPPRWRAQGETLGHHSGAKLA